MDQLTVDILWLTLKVQAARIVRRIGRESGMAIEIKGLRDQALEARSNLDRIKAAYTKFNEAAPAHALDVEGLAEQVGTMQSDLEFAATVLGNSPPPGQSVPVSAPVPTPLPPAPVLVENNQASESPANIVNHSVARAVPSRRDL